MRSAGSGKKLSSDPYRNQSGTKSGRICCFSATCFDHACNFLEQILDIQREKYEKHVLLYCSLMDELKVRIRSIDALLNDPRRLPARIMTDCCNLQLRFCCEDLALACLVIHQDIPAATTRDLRKTYEPGKIIASLDKLHPDFFPTPVSIKKQTSKSARVHFVESSSNHLSKADVANLWGQLGNSLHKGNLKRLLSSADPVRKSFPDITAWRDKFVNLLASHKVSSLDKRLEYVCEMHFKLPERPFVIIGVNQPAAHTPAERA